MHSAGLVALVDTILLLSWRRPAMLLRDIGKLERRLGESNFHYVANYSANVILTNLPVIPPAI